MGLQLIGLERFQKRLEAVAFSGARAFVGAMYAEAEKIMTVSKQDYVPVDTGALRASGYVQAPRDLGGGKFEVELGYGGAAAPYAILVHENLLAQHPVGQAKYLETPLKAALQGMPAVLAQRTNDAVRQAFQHLRRVERRIGAVG